MTRRPAVFDCNVFLQAMLSERGAARACWERVAADEVELFVTQYMIDEIEALPDKRELRRYRQITGSRVDAFVKQLRAVARLVDDPPPLFAYSRDPDDAHYVNVALATGAMLVVSRDRDLLDLMTEINPEGKSLRNSYPSFQVLTPPQFLKTLDPS